MAHALSATDSTSIEVLLDIPSEDQLLSVTLAALPRPGDHVRIAFAIRANSGLAKTPMKREFRVERVTFSGTLKLRGDEWRGAPFSTILEVTEVPVNKAFLPPPEQDRSNSAPEGSLSGTRLRSDESDGPPD